MKKTDFQFFVTAHKTTETDKGNTYTLELKTGGGHKIIFKGGSKDLFEGFPIGLAVGVKLFNPQTTLGELKGSENVSEEEPEEGEPTKEEIEEEEPTEE